MLLDKNQIDSSVTTVEQAIIYLSLCLDEGEVNEGKHKGLRTIEALNKFKLSSTPSNLGLWARVEQFRDIPFQPINSLPSNSYTVAPPQPLPAPFIPIGSLKVVNTRIQPREQTSLFITVETNIRRTEVFLHTNTPYVWDRFDFASPLLQDCENIQFNEDRSSLSFTATSFTCQLSIPSKDANDVVNFHFPLMLEIPEGKTENYKDIVIISMTNEFQEEYKTDFQKFYLAGREWIIDWDYEFECYSVNSYINSNAEFQNLSTTVYVTKIIDKVSSIIAVPVTLVETPFYGNPSKMRTRAGFEMLKSIQYLLKES